jgi:FkbM family methyltransferase
MQGEFVKSLRAVIEEFQGGQLIREDFWHAMQERHLRLREYQNLIAGTTVESIEILGDELRIKTREGISMVWHPEDLSTVPNALVNYGVYEPIESSLLLEAGNGSHVIFDVGANVGFYSLHWASRLAPGGTIHAFEPVPSTFAWLRRNVALNNLEGVIQANNFGLSTEPKSLSIFLPKFSGSGAASMKNLHPDEASVQVEAQVDTLDRHFSASGLNRLDLIKIDVEGAELFVLQGGWRTIEEHRPLIFLELLRKWSKPFGYHPNDVIQMLGKIGYCCFTFDEGRLIRFQEMTEETVQKNFFFALPEVHRNWLSVHDLI